MDPSRALWIGGAQGTGKSSVARALSRQFDLQLYVVDQRTWVHEPRMPPTEFRLLTLDERWVRAEPGRMLEWFVNESRHRFRLVLEDLRELPEAPAVVVEGPQLFPVFVAAVTGSPRRALFLLLPPEEQRARLLGRGPMPGTSDGVAARANATERDLLIAERFAREARELQFEALTVDRPLAGMIALAADWFRPELEARMPDGDLAAARHRENDVLATQVRLYVESLGDDAPPDTPLAFACECGGPGCADDVSLTLAEYEALSAAGDRSRLQGPRS